MRAFLKKDVLVYWRDRKQNIFSLVIPLILIVVLGLLLPNWIENPTSTLQLKAAMVVHDNEAAGLEQFQSSLKSRGLPDEEAAVLFELAALSPPVSLLNDMLKSDQIVSMVEWVELDEEAALRRLQSGEIQAIVTLPEDFTLHILNKTLLDEGNGAAISLTSDDPSIEVGVLQGIIEGFTQQFNASSAIAHAGTHSAVTLNQEAVLPSIGGVETIEGVRVLTSFQYFTLAVGAMFAMYVAANSANKAITEKREHVFQRILLSGSHPLTYLAGKIIATLMMSLLQLTLVILICHFVLDLFPGYSLEFWLGFSLLMMMMCLIVAALGGLFTAAMFRMNANTANAIIQALLLIIGVIGGNFAPIYILPDAVQQLWEWTPNGLWLSTMIQWIQQESWEAAINGMLGLSAFIIAIIALSVWTFPKRGRI